MKVLYSSVATLRFSEEIHDSFRMEIQTDRELVNMLVTYHCIIAIAGMQVIAIPPAVTYWD